MRLWNGQKVRPVLAAASAALLAACAFPPAPEQAAAPTNTPYPFVTATPRPTLAPATPTASMPTTAPPPAGTPTATLRPTIGPSPTQPASSPEGSEPTLTVAPCPDQPEGVFRQVYEANPEVAQALGCATTPAGEEPRSWPVTVRFQPMERGYLLWLSNIGWYTGQPVIVVMLADGTYTRYEDTYQPGIDRAEGGPPAPEGLYRPREALGKAWRIIPGLIEQIGFGTQPESRLDTEMQLYEYGEMLYLPEPEAVFVLRRGVPNTWGVYPLNPSESP